MRVIWCHSENRIQGGIQRVDQHIAEIFGRHAIQVDEIIYNGREHLWSKFWSTIGMINQLHEKLPNGDVALFSHVNLAYRARQALEKHKIPYVIVLHGLEFFEDKAGRFESVLNTAQAVFCNSKQSANRAREKYPNATILQAYYPGLDLTTVAKKQEEPTQLKVLCVGRMDASERYKGHSELIRTWVKKEFSRSSQLNFVGGGDDLPRLKKMAQDDNSIHFVGQVCDDTLQAQYASHHIFCMPSSNEGQGLVYLEAMQAGLCVVALRESPAVEFIKHKETGWLLDSKSTDELNKCLDYLITHPEFVTKCGLNARQSVLSLDVKKQFEQKLLGVLKQCVA